MNQIIDASAAYKMLTSGEWDATISRSTEYSAPDLIVSELLNARWKVARAGQPAPDVQATLNFLTRLRIVPSLPYAANAARLSEHLRHPVYDCFYIAVAQQENGTLLTADEHLIRKLRAHNLDPLLA